MSKYLQRNPISLHIGILRYKRINMGILVIFHVQYWMVVAIVFRPFVISVASKQKTSCTLGMRLTVKPNTKPHLNWTYWILPSNNMQWTYQWSWINESKETRTNQIHTYNYTLHATFPSHELFQDKRIALMINNKRTTIKEPTTTTTTTTRKKQLK